MLEAVLFATTASNTCETPSLVLSGTVGFAGWRIGAKQTWVIQKNVPQGEVVAVLLRVVWVFKVFRVLCSSGSLGSLRS